MADIIIRNARILDGTGNPWYRGDLAVQDGLICSVGSVTESAPMIIDADDMCVCPGFIDMHAHPDLTLFYKRVQDYKLRQGITTEVSGNCGFTAAPLSTANAEALKKYTAFITPPEGVDWQWQTFHQYLQAVEASNPPTNIVPLVGQGTIRIAVMGFDQRSPTSSELKAMRSLTREAMEAGSFGISTGLVYVPGAYAETDEIISLSQIASEYDGLYATHMRDEGDRLLESIEEAISIGLIAKLPVQISHHKATGQRNHGKVHQSLKLISQARNQGLDITVDQYPYVAGSTTLQAVLPTWAQEGGVEQVVHRLRNANTRKIILHELQNEDGEVRLGGLLEDILITSVSTKDNMCLIGLTIKEISNLRDRSPQDVILDLLIEDNCAVGMILFSLSEDDVRTVLASSHTMIGTDGIYQIGNPHPRVYGTYPRILGRYVRESGILRLEEAIRKMTSFPAQKLGLHNKGLIRAGADADIVIFNPNTVIDVGTFQNPNQSPLGIEYVLVNGQPSIVRGEFTGTTAGRVLNKIRIN